ncbi:MAG TPA: hypothetical protein VJ755_04695 [Gemmatimonadales bacterium]|nr:hypothetical protein [Gemmatimonadales bacterium]
MVLLIGLLGCATHGSPAALGWSLGGEAHVFVTDDRFARDYYRGLTGSSHLRDSLARRPLVPVQVGRNARALVYSTSGATPATISLVRFHGRGRCGYDGIVTEFVLTFPTRVAGEGLPPAHKPVLAMLFNDADVRSGAVVGRSLTHGEALQLLNRVVKRAESKAPLLRPLILNADQAADAGEVVPLDGRYGVGFRARVLTAAGDTVLVSGVAVTDRELRELRWVVGPRRTRLTGGMIPRTSHDVRYSLRAPVAPGGSFVVIDEIADVSAGASRTTARDLASGGIVATQPLALRCP